MSRTQALAYNTDIIKNRNAVAMIGVVFFVLATTLGAYVRIPVPGSPVPITLQTFFVLLSGAVLGRKLGLAAMLGYLAVGGAFLLGPTGGYVIGFAVAAYLVGLLTERHVPAMASFIVGTIAIYLCGSAWLACTYRLGLVQTVTAGVLPFVPGDAIKIIAAVALYSRIATRTREIFNS